MKSPGVSEHCLFSFLVATINDPNLEEISFCITLPNLWLNGWENAHYS